MRIQPTMLRVLISLCLTLVLIGTVIFWFLAQSKNAADPQLVAAAKHSPVYYPESMPGGFTLDASSVSVTDVVTSYKLDYKKDKSVFISIQPIDPQLDKDSFRPTREFDAPIGHGYLTEYEERTTIAIFTDTSFVLLNSPQGIASNTVEALANSLRPLK